MRTTTAKAATIVEGLSTAEKVRMVSGRDYWTTQPLPEADVPSVMVADGPHGLRKQDASADHVGLSASLPATCFPTAVTLGSTWDVDLIERVGAALGREARAADIAVVLGPGLNIKRHLAGGRSFEYLSEDPFLSGKLAAAMVRGIQAQGVGACLKHFAVNNQESNRLIVDALVDKRTLHEIYLTGFEIAVRESEPWTVMSSYNKINGEHAGESRRLLTDILRNEWGFHGLVMTDWFATYDRPTAIAAGLDLEMPGSGGTWDAAVSAALADGSLAMSDLDRAATRVIDLALRANCRPDAGANAAATVDLAAHHDLARAAAAAGTVLLSNNGLLPLAPRASVALIGAFAQTPRYQGNGSSLVKPTQLDTVLESMRALTGDETEFTYAAGYDAATGETSDALVEEAIAAAWGKDVVVVLAGLPGRMESEGYDREHLRLPDGHNRLIEAVLGANTSTAVVLMNGAPVELPWADRAGAIIEAYLGGQAGGSALVDILTGAAEPGGRLAESFPFEASDLAADQNFPGEPTQVEYREGLNVGYRFHDTAGIAPRFPFGHGLSYTTFDFGQARLDRAGDDYTVTVAVTNTGRRAGSDVVQVYVRDVEASVPRPHQELKGFAKVWLKPGESQDVAITLDRRAFALYDASAADWLVEAGDFEILVGASSRDIRSRAVVKVESRDRITPVVAAAGAVATDAEFVALRGLPTPTPRPLLPFHRDSTLEHLRLTLLGRLLSGSIVRGAKRAMGGEDDPDSQAVMSAMLQQMPLRGVSMGSGGRFSLRSLDRVIRTINVLSVRAFIARRRSRSR